jgi:branched-chain amino acid aminotransferase
MVDNVGRIAEGTMTNVFMVTGGILYTPRLDGGVFPGIIREIVLELAREMEMEVLEEPFTSKELFTADEIWLTNSAIGILPVRSLSGRRIFSPWPRYEKVAAAYWDMVEGECED